MFLLLASIFSFSCKIDKKQAVEIPEVSAILGLATPINLGIDSTVIYLSDFFDNVKQIDSINCDKNLSFSFSDDKLELFLKVESDKLPKLSVLDVYVNKIKYSILLKKSRKIKYEFIFDPRGKSYETVKLMGEMNSWNPENTYLEFGQGVWTTLIEAEPGEYQYLLVLDNEQQLDPNNSSQVSNNMGGFNSLMSVGKVDDSKLPVLYTKSFSDNKIIIGTSEKIGNIKVFFQNFELTDAYIKKNKSTYEIRIPSQAKESLRAYIRVWASNKYGFSNDIKIPLNNGKVLDNKNDILRTDYEAAVIYNVFIDRFFDGNPDNNRPINKPELVNPKADYMGGDIKGVIDKSISGFFDELGVNTIWLSPIVKNVEGAYGQWPNPETKFSAYHGYWPISLTQIDDRFGTKEDFKSLVDILHDDNKNIILDYVAHHVHESAPLFKENPDWVTDLYLPDGTLNTERWDDHRLTTWFDIFLPTLDNSRPEVYNLVSDSAVFWIEEYGIDGFRHDAAKHVPLVFWRTLTKKIKTQIERKNDKKIYQIGETYGTPELISSYINTGMLNAQFDFNVYDAISTALSVGNSFKSVENQLKTTFKYYGTHNLMGNITGNQDRGRFISYAGGTLDYSEDAKLAGWTRNIDVGDSVAYKKSAMLFAFITTIPGIPVVYYGDEIGMPGGNDPDNRRMMKFENLMPKQKELRNIVSELIKFRTSSLPLIFGDFKFLFVKDDVMVYQRNYFGKLVIVAFNNSNTNQKIIIELPKEYDYSAVKTKYNSSFKLKNKSFELELKAASFEIIFN